MIHRMHLRLVLLAIAVSQLIACERDCAFVWREVSPDGRFEIVLCRLAQSGAMMPGQGGDAPGRILLVQRATGEVLQSTEIAMVNAMTDVSWSPGHVHVKLFADWDLPAEPTEVRK